LINYNIDIGNKKFTCNNTLEKNAICCVIGCDDNANSNITLTAGNRIFNLKVCENCKKKLED
jgi:hypothetical protein